MVRRIPARVALPALAALAALALVALLAGCSSTTEVDGSDDASFTDAAAARGHDEPVIVVAHRGAHLRAPENSLAAIREAARIGADMVELDARTTKDGELVLMHDEDLSRLTGKRGEIALLPASEVLATELRAPDRAFKGEKIPRLADALKLARESGVGVYLHVKAAKPEAIASAVAGWSGPPLLVYGDHRFLRVLHLVAPDVKVMPELRDGAPADLKADLDTRWFASSISRLKMGDSEAVHRLGGRLIVDVLGDDAWLERRIRHALSLGVDGVQVDAPERALAVLKRASRKPAAPAEASFPKSGG